MDILNLKVKHKIFGNGIITEFDGAYFTVQFSQKVSKFTYPSAFDGFLAFEDPYQQNKIEQVISELKKSNAEKMRRKQEQAPEKIPSQKTSKTNSFASKIDNMFSEDYHAVHLAREPILTYQQVEKEFGIKISGFGRGINVTPSSVVLISSIGSSEGHFVYHDKWTESGEYLYSGEGKTGDQKMTKGNLAIKSAKENNKTIHLFVKFSPREYYYQGQFELVDFYIENDQDESGTIRKEYKFRLKKIT